MTYLILNVISNVAFLNRFFFNYFLDSNLKIRDVEVIEAIIFQLLVYRDTETSSHPKKNFFFFTQTHIFYSVLSKLEHLTYWRERER